ncbi:glucosidase [Virgisporangium aliadipatigenens]|uniref:Glucosidase n=1 Tax=Virgisporangium aliadipatigenens TaxID=741659 RepID=A0A8J4DR49_9ACTN|nr:glucosidase [Virgisporangium aliadipatigenens]GIJ46408.1 glucosidase [Virgisporangium aliadipatigenens]
MIGNGGAERTRLADADAGARPWRSWGPYLSERAWGTVREDYSEYGTAWDYFPHDHARSRTYRWNEDGMAGICDDRQLFCFALALWNGRDPILKERMFGLGGHDGNHGEDVKEYWWYTDSTPTHSWMGWRYHYPQRAFPYRDLVDGNHRRGRDEPEYELADTGVFDEDRYWSVQVDYAKADPTDMCIRITVVNRGPEPATLHLLPTLWFRNTWSWGLPGRDYAPEIRGAGSTLVAEHRELGRLVLAGDGAPVPLLCDNETNADRLFGLPGRSAFPKDGINDHLLHGHATVNPDGVGTKGALHYTLEVPAGGEATIRLRLTAGGDLDVADGHDAVMACRAREADEFFDSVIPAGASEDERRVARLGIAGVLWGKQFFHFDVARWLDGDPASPPPPASRKHGRNSHWRHMNSCDVISMPDPWEYPWYAAWDLAFHAVTIARVDPGFAKSQLLLLLRDWYLHPNGQIPAYEWAFGDVNPPVHAWAALRVFRLDGGRDYDFLERVLHKLLLNFTWWVNRKDANGNNVFEGGFLGLDNVGPFDRSAALPVAGVLEQSDGTAWMAMYALNLLEIALVLADHDHVYEDIATKFFEHFAYIAEAASRYGLWDEHDAFFYDVLRTVEGHTVPLKIRSVVGLLPLAAATVIPSRTLRKLPDLANRLRWFLANRPAYTDVVGAAASRFGQRVRLLSMVGTDQFTRILSRMLSPGEFLGEYGLRTLSRAHLDEPYTVHLGGSDFTVGYEPGESASGLFGGNSNWRGPIWFPVNYVLIEALRRYAEFYGDALLVEYPAGSGNRTTLNAIADDLSRRLIRLFTVDGAGRRPVFGDSALFQNDPHWRDLVLFYEYFHGDSGAGLGASHQTGWTALVVDLILEVHQDRSDRPRD